MNLSELNITQTHQGLIKKKFSARELCQAYLDNIEKKDKEIFAYLILTQDLAISQAKKIDEIISKEREIPLLAGIPLAVKDNILVEDVRCTAASKILENYIAPYDATVIKKLKEQGVVILGKTNLDEFAMGSSTENSTFGPTKNPHNLTRVPGGSSGGSAAAVAANFCLFALGSDTGGSIRQPASFCGVIGLKPTYGRVSRYGLIAFASSLDQIGPLTKTVEDAKIVFEAIARKDELDSTSVESKIQKGARKAGGRRVGWSPKVPRQKSGRVVGELESKIQNLRIGVPKEYFTKGIDPEVEKLIKAAIKKYEEMGAKIEEVSLPHTEYALAVYYIIAPSEASANLARYDGIKYGYSKIQKGARKAGGRRVGWSPKFKIQNLLDVYLQSRGEGFGEEVRRRIMLGTYALSAGYYEAFYLKAQKVRTLIKEDFDKAFQKVEVILTPTSPTPPFKLGEKIEDPLKMYLSDIFTVSVNLAGLPALSLPCGKVNNLPVGLQLIGKPFEEKKILEIGQVFETWR